MSKKVNEDTNEVSPKKKKRIRRFFKDQSSGAFDTFIVRPLGVSYIADASSNFTGLTKDTLSKAFSFRKAKELYKVYTDDEKIQCEYSFDQMLRKEGWKEEKIKTRIIVQEFTKAIFLAFVLGIVFYLVNYIASNPLSISTFVYGFPAVATIYLLSFILTIVSWNVYKLRHRELLTHRKFMSIALREFGYFIPFWENQEDIDEEKERLNKEKQNREKLKKNEDVMNELREKRNKNNKKENK